MIDTTSHEPVELRSAMSEEVGLEACITTPAEDVHQHRGGFARKLRFEI